MTGTTFVIAFGVAAAVLLLVTFVPRTAVGRAQDRLAKRLLAAKAEPPSLLTRAERVTGKWRRIPGVLGITDGALSFTGLFGETWLLAMPRIAKIATGRRMASGRLLFRWEVLRITAMEGSEEEFVLTAASASAWRSHLGLWAMAERLRDAEGAKSVAEKVVPGR